jgi:predicted N-acetyltransferase YhbS
MSGSGGVTVRVMTEADLPEADRICQLAFGTFFGAAEPETFFGDSEMVRTRWRADPSAALVAEADGRLVGSNLVTRWGSVAFFGPLTVDPAYWDGGVAKLLLRPTMEMIDSWGVSHAGLFTFAASAKHVGLYQKFGFWPRFLTAVMSRPVESGPDTAPAAGPGAGAAALSGLSGADRDSAIAAARDVTGACYPGLDVSLEITAVLDQGLGDVVLLEGGTGGGGPDGVAVCHIGAGSEAGGGVCYIKFGAVRPGAGAETRFTRLLDACHRLAAGHGATSLAAGANGGRDQAWQALTAYGFRSSMQGVAMHRPNSDGYNVSGSWIIDDWR